MTSTTHETEITVDATVPAIRITREFDAPVERVFRAHTDPEVLTQWLGPRDIQMRVDIFDCRTGGSYRYVHSRGSEEFCFRGCFHEVRPSELIVQTFTFEGAPDGVSLERISFQPLQGPRTRLVVSGLVESFEIRDSILSSGMEYGVRDGYQKLDELLVK